VDRGVGNTTVGVLAAGLVAADLGVAALGLISAQAFLVHDFALAA
jgi:hypothetical protein